MGADVSVVGPEPLVSVVILNYKRRQALARCLASARMQAYSPREIIVADNASGDGIAEYLAMEWPEVKLVELASNRGATGGRNAGIRAAQGEILVTVDNDIFFESPEELGRIVARFAAHPEIAVLACQLCDEVTGEVRVREWCHTRPMEDFRYQAFETHYFIEGASAYRREVFERVGGYWEPMFLCAEGDELGLRILDAGFRIRFEPEIRFRHLMSPETRGKGRCIKLQTRNYVWMARKDFRLRAGCAFLARNLALMAYFGVKNRQVGDYVRGLWAGVRGWKMAGAERTPIRAETVRYLREMERWRPSLRARLRRHREGIQL